MSGLRSLKVKLIKIKEAKTNDGTYQRNHKTVYTGGDKLY